MRQRRVRKGRIVGACAGAVLIGGLFVLGACLQPIDGEPGYRLITREDYSIVFGFLFAFIVAAGIGGGLGYWLGGRIVAQRVATKGLQTAVPLPQGTDALSVQIDARSAQTPGGQVATIPNYRVYHNAKWNLTLSYPADWEVLWENEPDGGWEIIAGVAGARSAMGRPFVTVRVLLGAVINFYPENVVVEVAGSFGDPVELPRSLEEYNEGCKQELRRVLPGVEFVSEQTGRVAGMPAAMLVYGYPAGSGFIRETQVNLCGEKVTYRLLCEAPGDQLVLTEAYFAEVLAAFTPVAGR